MHDVMMARNSDVEPTLAEPPLVKESDDYTKPDDFGEFKGLADKALCDADHRLTEADFVDWQKRFREEMEAGGLWKRKRDLTLSVTGKKFFQQLMAKGSTEIAEVLCENEEAFLEGDDDVNFDELNNA